MYFCHGALNYNYYDWLLYLTHFQIKVIQSVNIGNFVYYGKTQMYQITNDVLFALQPVITSKQVYLCRFCTQPLTKPLDGCWNGKWSVSTNSYCFMCNKAAQSVMRRAACGECENHSSDWNHLNPSSSVHSFKKEMEAISPFCRTTDDAVF